MCIHTYVRMYCSTVQKTESNTQNITLLPLPKHYIHAYVFEVHAITVYKNYLQHYTLCK